MFLVYQSWNILVQARQSGGGAVDTANILLSQVRSDQKYCP